jgi:hypothetical protein
MGWHWPHLAVDFQEGVEPLEHWAPEGLVGAAAAVRFSIQGGWRESQDRAISEDAFHARSHRIEAREPHWACHVAAAAALVPARRNEEVRMAQVPRAR